jgi:putative NADH-flavin reductase
VRQALDAGHKVTAVVRDPARFDVSHPALEVATVADLTDPEVLRPVLETSDAAISGVGPRTRKDGPVASSATRGILRTMEASGVRRFVAVSAVPVGPVPKGESFVNRRILLPFINAFARDVYVDLAEMEDEIRRSATEWTIVRPPKLTNKPLAGKYRTIVGGMCLAATRSHVPMLPISCFACSSNLRRSSKPSASPISGLMKRLEVTHVHRIRRCHPPGHRR